MHGFSAIQPNPVLFVSVFREDFLKIFWATSLAGNVTT
jgi:hypothetical protein